MQTKLREFMAAYRREVSFCAIIFIIASLSFALGYLANREFNHAPIVIEKCAEAER